MKRALCVVFLSAGLTAVADAYKDPNPFADYGPAMTSTSERPLAADWSEANDDAIAKATSDAALAAVVADAASAKALLANVRPAYETEPLTLIQIAAVTQWVMLPDPWYCLFWDGPHAAGRKVWAEALNDRIAKSADDYVRTFCRQQLDLCKASE